MLVPRTVVRSQAERWMGTAVGLPGSRFNNEGPYAVGPSGRGRAWRDGCGPSYKPLPYVPKSPTAATPIVCHDAVGHVAGNKPWILGGNCCCTPTKQAYERGVREGTIESSVTYEQYLALYAAKGVVTDLDHKLCGNMCSKGPHVTMGGQCMATPTPGTAMYETVTYGPHKNLTAAKAPLP